MILFRYLVKQVLITMFAVTFTLLFVVISGRFVKYLAQAAAGDLPPEILFAVMFYRIPSFLELILPLSLFIGILLAYGRMYVESEMVVMSACGVSTNRLVAITLVPAALVAVVVAVLSLLASPMGIDKVQRLLLDIESSVGLQLLTEGRFRVDDDTGQVTYIERLNKERRELGLVFAADQQSNAAGERALAVVLADRGRLETDPKTGHQYIVLDSGYRYLGEPGRVNYQITAFERFGQLIEEKQQRPYSQKIDAKPTAELLQSDKPRDVATMQWRISLALLTPVVALMALALSKTDHRRGRYVNMFPAFIWYMVYLVALSTARESVEKDQLPALLGLWSVHALFLAFALLTLYRGQLWRRLHVALGYNKARVPHAED